MFDSCLASWVHVSYCSACTTRDELPNEAAALQPPKEDPHLELLIAAFLCTPYEVWRKESGRAAHVAAGKPFRNHHQRRRRAE